MFDHAIVRPPGAGFADALSSAGLGRPDPARARAQHAVYCDALAACGLAVDALPADDELPDATFVEDTALLTPRGAVLCRPGAPSRQPEVARIAPAVTRWFAQPFAIEAPGTLDAGDVMAVDGHYFIGLSARTDAEGARQLVAILERLGYTASTVPLPAGGLHLKSSVSYLEGGNLLVSEALHDLPEFRRYRRVRVPAGEEAAANALWLNGRVLVAAGFPRTRAAVEALDYPVIALELGEFARADGGLSCLSLRFATPDVAAG